MEATRRHTAKKRKVAWASDGRNTAFKSNKLTLCKLMVITVITPLKQVFNLYASSKFLNLLIPKLMRAEYDEPL